MKSPNSPAQVCPQAQANLLKNRLEDCCNTYFQLQILHGEQFVVCTLIYLYNLEKWGSFYFCRIWIGFFSIKGSGSCVIFSAVDQGWYAQSCTLCWKTCIFDDYKSSEQDREGVKCDTALHQTFEIKQSCQWCLCVAECGLLLQLRQVLVPVQASQQLQDCGHQT